MKNPRYEQMVEMVKESDAGEIEDLVGVIAELAAAAYNDSVFNDWPDRAWLNAALTLTQARTEIRQRSGN